MEPSITELYKELDALRQENSTLNKKVDSLANANAYAAELLAALEEANEREEKLVRQGEELDLQAKIDVVLKYEKNETRLLQRIIAIFKETPALRIQDLEVHPPPPQLVGSQSRSESGDHKEAHARDSIAALKQTSRLKVENHQVHLPIPVQENSQGTILLTVRSCDAVWCDRWLRFLESISSQIGLTILRLRIEAENEKINSELIVARDQALESNRSKTLFLANMSHELRTPLNAILGYADLLAEDSRKLSPDEIGRDLSKIKKAGKHLLNLINDVLDMAKIESGKTTISAEDFDISDLVKDTLNTSETIASSNRNVIQCSISSDIGRMKSDSLKIQQCLLNLLSNACKFSSHGTVDLIVEAFENNRAPWIRFSVIDQGIGISESQIERLFQPFVQADDSTTKRYGGTGLGLAITKNYIRLLGGDIHVRSQLGSGSTFIIELPRALSDERIESSSKLCSTSTPKKNPSLSNDDVVAKSFESLPRSMQERQSQQGTVLAIDDDTDSLELIHRFFSNQGYHVVTTNQADTGLILAKSQKPDVILLDVMMPNLNGWQVLATLKADTSLSSIPVVLLTAHDNKSIGMALGAKACLSKPIVWDDLISTVSKTVLVHRSRYVLIVEDDSASSDILSRTISRNGWVPRIASNGKEAIKIAELNPPSLIILDLMMPEMDGFTCLDLLRASPKTTTVPIIVLTNKPLTQDELQRLQGPAIKILTKVNTNRSEIVSLARSLIGQE